MTRRVLLAGTLLLACNDLPDVTVVGTHVEVAADPELTMCGGTLAHMDAFVERVSATFSLPPPVGADRLRIYWLEHSEFYARSECPPTAYACAKGTESFMRALPVNHELVHSVTSTIGDPRPLFVEGLAVALQGLGNDVAQANLGFPSTGEELPDLDLRDLMTAPTGVHLIELGAYPLVGAFVAFLLRKHGFEAFARLYASIGYRDTLAQIDRVFRDELGVSLDESIDDFEATASFCTPKEYDAKLIECAAPELAWSGDVLVHHQSLACDQDDVVGPYGGDSAVAFFTLEIPEAGGYELRVLGEPAEFGEGLRSAVSLIPCTPCSGLEQAAYAGLPPQTIWFEPGRYSVRFRGPASTPTSVGLRLARVPDFPRPTPLE